MAAPDDGLGPHTLLWQFLGDRRFQLALPRAVGLQLLHPAIAAGIRAHSRTPRHVWLHERHTVPILVAIAYDDRDLSTVIRFGHEDVKGRDAFGRRYHALNPDVFFFQHATYVDTLVTMVETFIRPLDPGEHEQLYRECCAWYRRYGISTRAMPETWPEFERYFADACAQLTRPGPDSEYYRGQILRPDHWVVRRVPTPAVRQLLYPRTRELLGVPDTGSAALTAYAEWRRAIAALGPRHRWVDVAERALRAPARDQADGVAAP